MKTNQIIFLSLVLLSIYPKLVYSQESTQYRNLYLHTDREQYFLGDAIWYKVYYLDGQTLKFDDSQCKNDLWSNLSLVVLDEFVHGERGPSMNIFSWLLIDSELKGHIESPNDYFFNEREITSTTKLDLLMLTQGWVSNYVSDEYPESDFQEVKGFSLSGEVKEEL